MASKSFVFRFADIEVREREYVVVRAGVVLPVEPKAFRVLLILLRNPQKLIAKEELLNAVWGDAAVTENSLTRSIALLRRQLGDDSHNARYIETDATVGYRFLCPVEASEDGFQSSVPTGERETSGEEFVARDREAPLPTTSAVAPMSVEAPARNRGRKQRRLWLWILTGGVTATAAGALVWFLGRPLPPPRITEYVPVTHDGHVGSIAGTDGSRIYFNAYPWGPVEQVGVSGGEIATVPTGLKQAYALDVSSDGGNLLIWSFDPNRLWAMGTLGGPPRFIADSNGHCNLAWSPDARYIAYSDCSGGLFTMRGDATEVSKLVTVKGDIADIAWSPDTSRIRFTVNDTLWEISSTGANLRPVLTGWKGPKGLCCGRWTPDGKFYLFLAGGKSDVGPNLGGFEQIWGLDERKEMFRRVSREPLQLTSGPIRWRVPIPSRDGGKIFAVGTTSRGELVRFESKSKQFQPFLGGISAEFLSFSKDGRQIAYVTYPDGILWRAKPDRTERVQLTSPPIYPFVCRWSPDGTQILFGAPRDPSHYGMYVVPAKGGSPVPIVPSENGGEAVDASWSPDGHKILYHTFDGGPKLHTYDLDRHESTDIPGSDGLWSPRWSPDGRYIAAMTVPNITIKLFDLKTQQWSTLVEHMGGWGFPTWAHDGKSCMH
jgi:Tol biopolymer transport system component/DNA-binding winged helix-turn-helix (wHTH) protein